jgi:hypothetical protein
MPRTVNAVPTKGPYAVEVTVRTGDGEKQNTTTISDTASIDNGENMIAYSAMKSAKRAYRSICWGLVKREHPLLAESDKEFGLIWRATLAGLDITVRTSEEMELQKVENERLLKWSTGRRYHLWCSWLQLGYAWESVQMVVYELWRAIRG